MRFMVIVKATNQVSRYNAEGPRRERALPHTWGLGPAKQPVRSRRHGGSQWALPSAGLCLRGASISAGLRKVFEAEDFGPVFTPELREQEKRLRAELEQPKGS
jgi:hypothetical protein